MKYHYQFKPTLIPTIATLIILLLFIKLGFWQLDRAKQNQTLMHNYIQRSILPPLTAQDLNKSPLNLNFFHIQLSGFYDNPHSLLLDNKIYRGQLGYQVLTPFILNNHKIVLINRGWISQGHSREQLPLIPAATDNQLINGIIRIPEKSFTLGPNETTISWPLLIQRIEIANLSQMIGKSLYPVIIELSPNQPSGFICDWSPLNYVSPQRNRGYAVQWFTLALTLIIIFIALNLHRKSK